MSTATAFGQEAPDYVYAVVDVDGDIRETNESLEYLVDSYDFDVAGEDSVRLVRYEIESIGTAIVPEPVAYEFVPD